MKKKGTAPILLSEYSDKMGAVPFSSEILLILRKKFFTTSGMCCGDVVSEGVKISRQRTRNFIERNFAWSKFRVLRTTRHSAFHCCIEKFLELAFAGLGSFGVVFGRLYFAQEIELPLFLQFIIYQYPRAVAIFVDLALALILSAARPVQKRL